MRRSGRASRLWWILLLAPAAVTAGPEGREAARYDEAGVAPAYAWTVAGGNSAGSGESATPLPRGPLEVAWKSELPGEIEGEPLVWDERIVVAIHRGGGKRELHMLGRADGKAIGAPVRWQSPSPPNPALWGSFCLAVTKPGGISAYRLGRERLELKWYQSIPGVYRAVPVGRDVYVMSRAMVECWRIGESKPRWTCLPLTDVAGILSGKPSAVPVIRGDTIYFFGYDEEGNAYVTTADRRTGAESTTKVYVGNHGGSVPSEPAELVALEGALVVRFGAEISGRSGPGANAALCALPLSQDRVHMLRLHGLPVAAGRGFLANLLDADQQAQLVHFADVTGKLGRGRVLADRRRPDLNRPRMPITVSDGQAVVDSTRFIVRTGEVLTPLPVDTLEGRVVPVRGGLLAKTGANTLTLMREVQPPPGPPAILRADRWAAAVPEGAIALADGSVLKGPLVREATAQAVEGTTDAKLRSRHPMADVLAVVDGKGALLLAPDADGAVRGVTLVGEAREAAAYAMLARDAIAAKDLARGERALREALARGASDAVVGPLEKGLEELRKYAASATVKPLRQDVLTEAENAIHRSRAQAFWTASASLPTDAPWLLKSRLVRAALASDPAHAESVEFVRSAVPAVFRLGPTFDALNWLSLVDAVQHAPVTPVEDEVAGRPPTPSQRAAERARADWKPDLLALQSRQLLVLTDVRDPARIGVCVSMGELVCRTLERLLGDAVGGRMDPDRLTLHLFETKEGYLASSPGKGETGRGLENTAGHYDPGANLSRIYLPEGPEAFEEVAGTYAHELTHHWVFQRCPLFKDAELARNPGVTPGFWIVEGMADFLAEGLYDVGRHEADLFNPRSLSLDMVANAPDGGLIPWPRFFALNQAFFHRLDTTRPIVIPTRWRLGWLQSPTEVSMFYAQGAAVCHYLYGAHGAKYRAMLQTLVRDYYTGRTADEHIQQVLGMTPDALGKAVVQYAHAMQAGQVPKPVGLGR